MKNKNNSDFSNKLFVILLYIVGILLIVIGLPFFKSGGFIIVALGMFCFFIPKINKNQNKETSNNIKSKDSKPGLDYVYINKKGKAYHWDPYCRSMGSNYEIITRDEAKAKGLKPCKHCNTY